MSFFNFFSSKKTNFTENMRQAPAFSRSIYMKSVDAYLMMVMYDKDGLEPRRQDSLCDLG